MHCIVRYPERLLLRISDAATEPVLLADAKNYLRVDITDDDALITNLITAARQAAEEYMHRSLITQSWKLAFDWLDGRFGMRRKWYFIGYELRAVPLPRGLVQAITSVTAYDINNNATTVDNGTYRLNAAQDALIFLQPVSACRMEIVYTAGYGNAASSVPQPIIYGIQAHIAAMYDARGEVSVPLPPGSAALYSPYREVLL